MSNLLTKKELEIVELKIESDTFYNAMYEHLFPNVIKNKRFQLLRDDYLMAIEELQEFIKESKTKIDEGS